MLQVTIRLKIGTTRNRCHPIDFRCFLGGFLRIIVSSVYQIRSFHDAAVEASSNGWKGPIFIQALCRFNEHDMMIFAGALMQCHSLVQLDLSNTGINNETMALLAPALPSCAVLADLKLSNNSIGNAGGTALARAMPRCPALHTLHLEHNILDSAAADRLSDAIRNCSNLRSIHLTANPVGRAALARLRLAAPTVAVTSQPEKSGRRRNPVQEQGET